MEKEKLIRILTYVVNTLIVLYLAFLHILAISQPVNYLSLVFMFLICLLTLLKKERFIVPLEFLFLIAFSILCLFSLTWSPNPSLGFGLSFKTIPLLTIMTLLIYNHVRQNKNPEILVCAVYATGVVMTISMIVAYGGVGNLLHLMREGYRLGGIVNNANDVGMALSLASVVAFFLFLNKKYWNIFPAIVFAITSMATGSRKVVIMLALGGFLSVISLLDFSKGKGKRNTLILSSSLLFIVLCFVMLFTVPAFLNMKTRFLTMLNSLAGKAGGDGSTDTRMEMIKVGWNTFKSHPFLGLGIGTSSLLGFNTYLHNNFIEILASLGLLGFMLYYSIYVVSFFRAIPLIKQRNKTAILAIVINVCWIAVQVGTVTYETKDTYYYLALLSVLSGIYRDEAYEKKAIDNKLPLILID